MEQGNGQIEEVVTSQDVPKYRKVLAAIGIFIAYSTILLALTTTVIIGTLILSELNEKGKLGCWDSPIIFFPAVFSLISVIFFFSVRKIYQKQSKFGLVISGILFAIGVVYCIIVASLGHCG